MPNNAQPYQAPQPTPKQSEQQRGVAPKPKVTRQKIDHPNSLDKGAGTKQAFENEGEGSRSAARNYDKATEDYVRSGRVEAAAREAEQAVDGEEGEELRRAELATTATQPDGPRAATPKPNAAK